MPERNALTAKIEVLRRAAEGAPDNAALLLELAVALTQAGDMRGAEAGYQRVLCLQPDNPVALGNLAAILIRGARAEEAEPLLRHALAIDPDDAAALRNLGVLLKDAGRFEEAKALALRAAHLDHGIEIAFQAHLPLTPMQRSEEDAATQRAAYAQGLEAIAADPRPLTYRGEPANLPWYFLPYHGLADRPLIERTGEVLAAKVQRPQDANLSRWRPPVDRRLRVTFCSEFLGAHTVGRLFGGLIRGLDRSRFAVTIAHSPNGTADTVRAELDRAVDRALVLPKDPAGQRRVFASLAPDVLFYPDIGMSAATWFLAQSRLAPVQATSWGHPSTTGQPHIDYFVSADCIEPSGAEAQYTERLVRLGRLPSWYPTPLPPVPATRADLELPVEGVLYGCPQTLFKFHPTFDAALARIAEGDRSGHIILVSATNPAWTRVLTERWSRRFPILLERVTFLRRLNHLGFMAHLAHIDVLLDPWPFGSGNTLYEALSIGTPIVTWPGTHMKSRIVAGAYAQIGAIDAPVASSAEDYIARALALGRDASRRAVLQSDLKARASRHLFEDGVAVQEFAAFLEAAVAAAGRGERLPAGWRPSKETA